MKMGRVTEAQFIAVLLTGLAQQRFAGGARRSVAWALV